MKQLHFHERGAHVVMYNATDRSLYDKYSEFNAIVEELERLGTEDLVRRDSHPTSSSTVSRWTCGTETSW